MIRTATVQVVTTCVLFFILSSCSGNEDKDLEVFKVLDETLANSNNTIQHATDGVLISLENKLIDPTTRYKAEVWYPHAKRIAELTKDMYKYLEALKYELNKEIYLDNSNGKKLSGDGGRDAVARLLSTKEKDLYNRLKEYIDSVFILNSNLKEVFHNTILLTTKSFDSIDKKRQTFGKDFFDKMPADMALTMLTRLQSMIKIMENRFITFCDNKVGSTGGHWYSYSAIVTQSSKYVLAGEKVEITAGIGAFSRAVLPDIIINGKQVQVDESGAAVYSLRAPSKPGKHIVPVKIGFIDQDGKRLEMSKKIDFTVVDSNN